MADDETTAPIEPLPLPTSTTFDIAGATIDRHLGACFGLVVRSTGFVKGLKGGIKSLHHGEVTEYTGTLEQARRHALERMIDHAQAMGANAVVGARFDCSQLAIGDQHVGRDLLGVAGTVGKAALDQDVGDLAGLAAPAADLATPELAYAEVVAYGTAVHASGEAVDDARGPATDHDTTTAPTDPLPLPTSTTFEIAGATVGDDVGACFGLVVRSPGFAKQMKGTIKSLRHGGVAEFGGNLEQARREALDRLAAHAQAIGGDAVVGARFDSSMGAFGEIVAYGTAVAVAG